MNLLYKDEPQSGYTSIVTRGDCDLKYIDFGLLRLSDGGTFAADVADEEIALVVLGGKCELTIECDGETIHDIIGERSNVFGGKAASAYIPRKTVYEIRAQGPVEIAVCKAPSELDAEPVIVTPDKVKVKVVGQHNWKRYVHDIIDADVTAQHLVIGETFNPPGNWSSSPPHRHDYENPPEECEMEEVYFYQIHPAQGFGVQRVYTDDLSLNETYTIGNNDTVAIPRGYHPVAAGPGYQLYYLWILAGENRVLRPKDDPNHTWLKYCEPIVAEL